MKNRVRINTVSMLMVGIYCLTIVPASAQLDDNKTFYQRTDGGVTVVDPDKNIFGNTEYKVRTYDSRDSAYQSEYATETAIAAMAIVAIVEAGKAIYNWWSAPASHSPTTAAPSRPTTPTQIEVLFGSEAAFVQATRVEIDRAVNEGRAFGASTTGVMMFGCNIVYDLMRLNDEKVYLVARVDKTTNPALRQGDIILRCNKQLMRPGVDLTTLLNTGMPESGKFSLQIIRDGIEQEVTAFARPVVQTAAEISDRRASDAVTAVVLNRRVEVEKLQVGWK